MKSSAYALGVAFSLCTVALAGCDPVARDPGVLTAPSFATGGLGRPSVLVNPSAHDSGTAKTIQEGIAMVAPGGKVLVVPGTYEEAIMINKGLTLETVGGESGPVTVSPPGMVFVAIQVATPEPVTIRGFTVRYTGVGGIFGVGAVDLTVEQTSVEAVNPPLGVGALIAVLNQAPSTGRARVVVRESFLDGTLPPANSPTPAFPQIFGIQVAGEVDARLGDNIIRRTGGACIFVIMNNNLGGETNADIVGNDLDECYPVGRAGSILVGAAAGFVPSPTNPVTATGAVNIVGNTIRNSVGSCLATSAILYETFGGRIEHNRILGVVPQCATPAVRGSPGAIWIGSLPTRGFPPVSVTVRFNDIVGNAQAGVRLAPNMTTPIDASCNWWGTSDGPSGVGPGTGDAIVVETGAATPTFIPFATAPIAETDATSC